LSYQFVNGAPTQLTMYGLHGVRTITKQDMSSLYAQDRWTRGRLTLQGGLRFEHIDASFPDQQIGPDRFIPVAIKFAARDAGVGVKDIMPRMGAAYDLFGTGRTAFKVSLGRYVTPTNSTEAYAGLQNPISRMATSTNRRVDRCQSRLRTGLRSVERCANGECGPWANRTSARRSLRPPTIPTSSTVGTSASTAGI
jgi:hypothetical protein